MAERNGVLFSKEEARRRMQEASDSGLIVRASDLPRQIKAPIPYEEARKYAAEEFLQGLGFNEVEIIFMKSFPIQIDQSDIFHKRRLPLSKIVQEYFRANWAKVQKMQESEYGLSLHTLNTPTKTRTVRISCLDFGGLLEGYEVGEL